MVDQCPECHGLWLDQGEIDLLIKAAEQQPTTHMMQDIISFFHRPNHPHYRR
jgi:Zn-finger nucleic acid-binding protein